MPGERALGPVGLRLESLGLLDPTTTTVALTSVSIYIYTFFVI